MAESAQIIQLADYRPTTDNGVSTSPTVAVVTEQILPVRSTSPVGFDDLYPSDQTTIARSVRSKLLENEARCRAARDDDAIERDDAINRFKVDLASIFALRGLSAGLEIVILSLFHCLHNKRGKVLSLPEYNEILSTLTRTANAPQLTVEDSLDLVERLHSVGLNTDPADAATLDEMLND